MKTLKNFILESESITEDSSCSVLSDKQLNDLEKFADRLLGQFGIDIEFTRHFKERMSDSRNDPCIAVYELQQLFKKIQKDKGAKIKAMGDNAEAVLKDLTKDLNIPFVIDYNGEDFEIKMKTIMRKKSFKSPDPSVVYETVVN